MQNLAPPYSVLYRESQSRTELRDDARFSDAGHLWSEEERRAVIHAWASDRPLLIRGEAGCGKSQLARAVAKILDVDLIVETIHPRYEATDLLYKEDPVKRLARAQMLAALQPKFDSMEKADQWLDKNLPVPLTRGPIWRAMKAEPPSQPAHAVWPRAVVLIDEIDKADADVPNTLLDVLGNRSFTVPATGDQVVCSHQQWPLVLITTNEDRELPAAFVRRCGVLNLQPDGVSGPKVVDEAAFEHWLCERARAHEKLAPLCVKEGELLARAARQVSADRKAAHQQNMPTVGLAEYLDLLYSLLRLSSGDPVRAGELLDQISAFALVKHRDQDQRRAPVAE